MPGSGEAAIELEGLTRAYGERTALSGVSVRLGHGQTLAVLGSNGAGKTTLLRILATLLRPHSGVVRILGRELPREGWAVRGRIGLLGHDPLLYRDLTGRENLEYHARLHDVAGRSERIATVLDAVGMTRRAEEPIRLLSRGMVQRLAVARAVLHDPELLLLDEPASHLDPAATALVEPLVGRSSGTTRVVVSHDPGGSIAEADLVLGLRRGEAAFVAPAAEVEEGRVRELYR